MIICDHIHPGSFDESTTIISISMFVESSPSEKCHFGDPILPSSSPDVPSKRADPGPNVMMPWVPWRATWCHLNLRLRSSTSTRSTIAASPHRTSFSGHVDHGGLSHESCHGKGAWIRISSDCISKSGESLLEVFAIRKMPACVVTEVLIQRKTLILKVKNHGFQQTLPFLEEKMVSGFLSMSLQLLHQDC